jgi:signal transduction histidine kinase
LNNPKVKFIFIGNKPKGSLLEYENLPITIGRDPDCDVTLEGKRISRLHARLDIVNNNIILINENSKNGILVNGLKFKGEAINKNSLIQIGEWLFKTQIVTEEDNEQVFNNIGFTVCEEIPTEVPDISNYKDIIKALISMHENIDEKNPIASSLKLLSSVLPINRIGVYYISENGEISKGETLSKLGNSELNMSQTLIRKVISLSKPILLVDVQELNEKDWGKTMIEEDVNSIIGCPILTMGRISAVIVCENLPGDITLSEEHLKVINLFGSLLNSIFQKEALKKIEEEKLFLEQLNKTKDKIFSVISHDLRTPFANLIETLSFICDKDFHNEFSDEEKHRMFNSILEQSKNTLSLLENLLKWSTTEKGVIDLEAKLIYIQPLLKSTVTSFETIALNKKIKLNINAQEEQTFYVDEPSVRIILTNLVNNAIKFTPEGGTISLNVITEKNESILEVADTGIGLDESLSDDLFNHKKHITTRGTNKEKGTGIGLGLCHELCKKNNGRIWYRSTPKKGSRFFIAFQIKQ